VAALSKLQRPSGDRVKTDARDARHLARLQHLGQIGEVTIPSAQQEAARDVVRAREDCLGDLMRVRHRVSKVLLRQGIVYYGGAAWTGKHELWLRSHKFQAPGLQLEGTHPVNEAAARDDGCGHFTLPLTNGPPYPFRPRRDGDRALPG
jgi:transposase